MDLLIYFVGWTVLFVCAGVFLHFLKKNKPPQQPAIVDLDQVHRLIEQIPNKVLQSIIGSTSSHKGKIGELIGYLKLQASYDRIIPLNDIADFVCINFGNDTQEGHIDFIDCKTGKAKLSSDQKKLKKLIEQKKINFLKMVIETENNNEEGNSPRD